MRCLVLSGKGITLERWDRRCWSGTIIWQLETWSAQLCWMVTDMISACINSGIIITRGPTRARLVTYLRKNRLMLNSRFVRSWLIRRATPPPLSSRNCNLKIISARGAKFHELINSILSFEKFASVKSFGITTSRAMLLRAHISRGTKRKLTLHTPDMPICSWSTFHVTLN